MKRDPDKVVVELERRLRSDLKRKGEFSRVHPLPPSGHDVPDDLDARLVVLGIDQACTKELRYRGLRGGKDVSLTETEPRGLLVKPEVARRQMDAESVPPSPLVDPEAATAGGAEPVTPGEGGVAPGPVPPVPVEPPRRYHGTVELDPARVGRDAGQIADEVISHLAGLVGAKVTVTLEIEAEVPSGVPETVVRTVTENGHTLRFTNQGFEKG